MLDYLKVLLPFLGGGLFGGLIVEWLRRRGARVQIIPLVVRVNRAVKPNIKGFTLARITGPNSAPEAVRSIHEYQFTLRNTSNVHLQNAEIQFEFDSPEVQALAERPALSNTPLQEIEIEAKEAKKSTFRWRIPQFPATDSIDFTFRAINPDWPTSPDFSGQRNFEVALYNSDRVVVKRGTDKSLLKSDQLMPRLNRIAAALLGTLVIMGGLLFYFTRGSNVGYINDGECNLRIESSFDQFDSFTWIPWGGPWKIDQHVTNLGRGNCSFQAQFSQSAVTLGANGDSHLVSYSAQKPQLQDQEILVGAGAVNRRINVALYSARP